MRGGRIAAEWLKTQGVTHVFALVGEHILPLVDGLDEAGIRVIGTRHEQAAVLAAEAFAKVTGTPGVAAVTAGPGVTNAVTGLAVANSTGTPVLLLQILTVCVVLVLLFPRSPTVVRTWAGGRRLLKEEK